MKKVVISARQNHDVMDSVIDKLKKSDKFELYLHDPQKNYFNLSRMPKAFKSAVLVIVKVRNDCSIDLLYYAKINNIPTFHDLDTVMMCKNKIALDYSLRNIFIKNPSIKKYFSLPQSWNQSLTKVSDFKRWAMKKLPIVLKSHNQHDKYNRFTFLVKSIDDVDIFCAKYNNFLTYDLYVQKFIECDGIDRKVYVIGEKVFGVKRENPIYLFMREKPNNIDVDKIQRKEFKVSREMANLAILLSKELKLKIFGFDLIKPINQEKFYLIDVNDFPGFKGIKNIENVLANYLKDYIINL